MDSYSLPILPSSNPFVLSDLMLATLLYDLWHYQIFKSVLFRGGMTFLTSYLIIIYWMPRLIYGFRTKGITSDFKTVSVQMPGRPYQGATPIMGGIVLVASIFVATLLWCQLNQYILALLLILVSFAAIGAWDDLAKVRHKRRVEKGEESQKSYTDKADGVSGKKRLFLEFAVAFFVVLMLYRYVEIDGHLVVPFLPLKTWYPYLPYYFFIPLMVFIIVGGANAVNLTDGLDSLVTVPLMTCTLFVASVAFIAGDPEWAARLKIPTLSEEVKEIWVFAMAILSAGFTFLRYNAPPALVYMGDLGALALGSVVSAMFIFVKAELFLPLVGGVFVISAISSVIQRLFFKYMLKQKGRAMAEQYRFFLRSPYHHHLQQLWTYSEQPRTVQSVWVLFLTKLGIPPIRQEDQLSNPFQVNSRVIWRMHLKSIGLFVAACILYFKVR